MGGETGGRGLKWEEGVGYRGWDRGMRERGWGGVIGGGEGHGGEGRRRYQVYKNSRNNDRSKTMRSQTKLTSKQEA